MQSSQDKLFVGQIPKNMTEDDLKPIFLPFGTVQDVHVLRDHATKNHKGCCFVTFSSREEAEACIYGLHGKITLPGMSNAVQVEWAGGSKGGASGGLRGGTTAGPGAPPGTTHKLFVGMVPKSYTEEDLKPLFTPFGEIKDMNVLRGQDGVSKGCAFILFQNVPSAIQAITTLDGKIKLEGAANNLVVQFSSSADKGRAQSTVNQTPLGMGFGLGGQGLMLQQPTFQIDPYGAYGYATPTLAGGLGAGAYGYGATSAVGGLSAGGLSAGGLSAGGLSAGGLSAGGDGVLGSNKEGPPGSNLFIYHLPKDYNDASVLQLYSQFGTVVSCKVILDKETGNSKGFGFVSYDTPEAAQMAVLNTNGMQVHTGKRLKVEVKPSRAQTNAARPY